METPTSKFSVLQRTLLKSEVAEIKTKELERGTAQYFLLSEKFAKFRWANSQSLFSDCEG